MAGVAHRTVTLASTDPGAIAAPLRSTALTAMALATLAMGLALLLLPGSPVTPELPPGLFAVALGMLIATLFVNRVGPSALASSDPHTFPNPSKTADSETAGPVRPTPPSSAGTARPSASGRGSAWRILSAPSDPGDETWLSWLPRERRRLGPEGSFAPGVVTSPGRAGNLVAFPVRDYFGGALPPAARGTPSPVPPRARERGIVGDEHLPALSSLRATPFSEEDLDRMFPPEGHRGPVFLAGAPDRIGGHSAWSGSTGFARPAVAPSEGSKAASGPASDSEVVEELASVAHGSSRSQPPGYGEPPGLDSTVRPVPTLEGREATPSTALSLEATNPIPPHLRASGPLLRYEHQTPARRGSRTSPSRSVCASCSKVVVDLRLSGPCPKCLRPLCSDCLREAFVTEGHGWCLDCASAGAVAG